MASSLEVTVPSEGGKHFLADNEFRCQVHQNPPQMAGSLEVTVPSEPLRWKGTLMLVNSDKVFINQTVCPVLILSMERFLYTK